MEDSYPKFKVRKTRLGRYPYFGVAFSIMLALFVVGVFVSLIIYSKELERVVREGITVQVFLQNDLTTKEKAKIQKALASKYFITKGISEKEAVRFVSKEIAAKQFINETGEDFQQLLGENPLRDAFLVTVAEEYQDKESLARVKNDLEKMRGIFQVYYVESVIESINKNITKISIVLLGVGILLFVIVVLLINNAVKLALFSQRFLIRSMQLVGATSWFIQRAFLYRALVTGLVSGIAASLLLFGLIRLGNQRVEDLQIIYNSHKIIILLGALIVLGIIVSSLSTFRVVNKFLKLSLDELN